MSELCQDDGERFPDLCHEFSVLVGLSTRFFLAAAVLFRHLAHLLCCLPQLFRCISQFLGRCALLLRTNTPALGAFAALFRVGTLSFLCINHFILKTRLLTFHAYCPFPFAQLDPYDRAGFTLSILLFGIPHPAQ